MKRFLLLTLFILPFVASATDVRDTVDYWQITYGKNVRLRGNVSVAAPAADVKIINGSAGELKVSYVTDRGHAESSSLTIKEGKEVLRVIASDPVMGATFTVPVRELISLHQKDSRFVLELYYSDSRGRKNLKLGTITFIIQ